MSTRRALLGSLFLACLASCAGPNLRTRSAAYAPTTGERVDQVLNQPLSDFNLSNAEIPPLLEKIAAAPYAAPAQAGCQGIDAEIAAITQLLGPDLAPTVLDPNGTIVTNGGAGEAAWGTARSAADGWIPFHGVVRVLSGAAHHDRMIEHAILAGFVRRAYLNGLREAAQCPAAFDNGSAKTAAEPVH